MWIQISISLFINKSKIEVWTALATITCSTWETLARKWKYSIVGIAFVNWLYFSFIILAKAIGVQYILRHRSRVRLLEERVWHKTRGAHLIWSVCWQWANVAPRFTITETARCCPPQRNPLRHTSSVSCKSDILVWYL